MTPSTPEIAQASAIVPCWNCKGPVASLALFCSTCGAVQPPGGVDHFSRLGFLPKFDLDQAELEKRYFAYQRRLHPDRFATKGPKEKALSQQQATALNDAYETLKDSLRRAAYLLALKGRPSGIDGSTTIDDPALLMEAMEMREALAEAETPEAVEKVAAKADQDLLEIRCALSQAFQHDDLDAAATLTTRLKYLTKLAEEARARKVRLKAR